MKNPFKRTPQAEKLRAAEAKIRELTSENENLRMVLNGIEEVEIKIAAGTFDMRARANWIRHLGLVLGEQFIQEGGPNYLEMEFTPTGPNIPEGFGRLIMTLQRETGRTPGQVAADMRRFWERRFRATPPDEVKPGVRYIVAFTRASMPESNKRWAIAQGYEIGPGSRGLKIFPAPPEGPESLNIAEIYEVVDPFTARPEYLPAEGKQFQFINESAVLTHSRYGELGGARLYPGAEKYTIVRGTLVTVKRQRGPGGKMRWFVYPADSPTRAVASFEDDEGEIPDYLAPPQN